MDGEQKKSLAKFRLEFFFLKTCKRLITGQKDFHRLALPLDSRRGRGNKTDLQLRCDCRNEEGEVVARVYITHTRKKNTDTKMQSSLTERGRPRMIRSKPKNCSILLQYDQVCARNLSFSDDIFLISAQRRRMPNGFT